MYILCINNTDDKHKRFNEPAKMYVPTFIVYSACTVATEFHSNVYVAKENPTQELKEILLCSDYNNTQNKTNMSKYFFHNNKQ